MTINSDGTFEPDTADLILDAMMADAALAFGSDINPSEYAKIRSYYKPVANRLAESQLDVALVLSNAQLENAEGQALDYITEALGVFRNDARRATGTVTFSRNSAATVDYPIAKGVKIQTNDADPIVFETTEKATLTAGQTSVDVAVQSVEGGVETNVGPGTITVMKQSVTGIESVTNVAATTGGADRENDDELRVRAKQEVGGGSRASAPALIRAARRISGVKSVDIFINDSGTVDGDGRDPHSFELVIDGGADQEIFDMILETKGAGDPAVGGYAGTLVSGTAELPNGQTHSLAFSRPALVPIYVSATLSTTDEFAGNDAVTDSIVTYIGGTLSSGNEQEGALEVGDDVIYGEVEYAIRSVAGVYDVTALTIGTSASPSGTSNITINDGEQATADATDGSLVIS